MAFTVYRFFGVERYKNTCKRLQHSQTFGGISLFLPFLDGDVSCLPSHGVYNSQIIRFARVCSHLEDFNARN